MPRLVLTVIGDDRAGLVAALSEVVAAHEGNWETSQLAEIAGQFAGLVVVSVPESRAAELRTNLGGLEGMLKVTVQAGEDEADEDADTEGTALVIDLLGNDHPGIVHEVSGVLARHRVSIDSMTTTRREAPMAGGFLFDAHLSVHIPAGTDVPALRADLERLATELLVDVTLE